MSEIKTGVNDRPDLSLAMIVGAGGMGMAVARRLGQHHRIMLIDKDAERIVQCLTALGAEGVDAIGRACDITDPDSVSDAVEAASAAGPVRVLGHVAGLSPSMGTWDMIMRVNLVGAALMEHAVLSVAGQGCAAVFISSLAAHGPAFSEEVQAILANPLAPDFVADLEKALPAEPTTAQAYQLSKFALNRMVERRAAAWGAKGARIVSLSPGLIATPMGALEFKNQPYKYELLSKTPIKREGTMVEIADAVEFLASNRASFISCTDLLVDGGIAAALKHQG